MALIAAGKHVLCEKPMTATLDEAAELVAAAERAKVILMTNNWRRNCPAFREIKQIIEGGWLRSAGVGILDRGKEVCVADKIRILFHPTAA